MALGLFDSQAVPAGADANRNSSNNSRLTNEKKHDLEVGVAGEPRLGRIATPVRRDMKDDSSDNSITVGKQMALEAENAIKYRTCSWPKVCVLALCPGHGLPLVSGVAVLTAPLDGGPAVLGVHLSGYHVISVVLLPAWSCTGFDIHGFHRWIGSLHIPNHLVSLSVAVSLACFLTKSRQFCLRHPEIRDVCDLGQMIFWNKPWAFYFTAVMFLLNNTFIMVRLLD